MAATYAGSQADNIIDNGKRKASEGFDNVKSTFSSAAEQISEKAHNLVSEDTVQQLRDGVDYARDKTMEQWDSITDKVRREPMTALAIAAGCGLLVGMLLRRTDR
jgi:ElaB/YqjD/DUF883 family membrane-anchored ribosome-binding protein